MYTYLGQRIVSEFESCGWEDRAAALFQERELRSIKEQLLSIQQMADEIERFVRETNQLL